MDTLLVEIGSEEIPAGYIQPALQAFSENLLQQLDKARIEHGRTRTYGTPRRLAVAVEAVAPRQKSLSAEVVGPPAKVAFDEKGKPTVAAKKFAEKVGLSLDKLQTKQTDKGAYLVARVTERGQATRRLLGEILPGVVESIPFPKTMRWSNFKMFFARPAHYVLALLGEKPVSFSMENMKSGRYTRGHFFMDGGRIRIGSPDDYLPALRKVRVLADVEERKKIVRKEVEKTAKKLGGRVLADEELMDINTNLVEYPFPTGARFDDVFLELPEEILITAMREHQKYFAVVDGKGKLMPCFIAVNNTRARDMKLVAKGHQRVIRARLKDAQFFYHSDLQESSDRRVEKLKGVLFQAKLGSMHEKVLRVQNLAERIAVKLKAGQKLKKMVSRAAYLCKADLVSQVVGEFPKLQGVMGRIYAKVSGEAPDVAAAIEEHYRPVYSGGALPETTVGAVLAISDKLDSICGCFSVGLIPTGASDPYALRRQGIGIVQIMLEKRFSLSLRELIEKSVSLFSEKSDKEPQETVQQVAAFLRGRVTNMLIDAGHSKDVVAAVVDVSFDCIPDVWQRAAALENLKKADDFESLATAFKRVVNIIRKADAADIGKVDPKLFEDPSESKLFKTYQRVSKVVAKELKAGDFEKALREIASLRPAVDAFFEDVLVMAEDERIRKNRLSLLGGISELFATIADFSKLAT
ncbi:MAG: glycine--tRNA ligase subunit beta [Desulfobacteraceae bacterium]|nr:glycine--tRNA ligase subunit beta [Desulfobacteraceae bacterium]